MDAISEPPLRPKARGKTPAAQDLPYSDAMAAHYYTHDLAIKAANWAMQEDPDCVAAHSRFRLAEVALDNARRDELVAARAEVVEARAAWMSVTEAAFDAVMTDRGFGWMLTIGGTDGRPRKAA
jgi:hypothetical protein